MKTLKWRYCFDDDMSLLKEALALLEGILEVEYNDVYEHLMNQTLNLVPYFCGIR